MVNAPVIFIFFNKSDTTKKVFAEISKAEPAKLYLVSDGPRIGVDSDEIVFELREWVEQHITWECEVIKIYSNKNMGCKMRVVTGINEVFEREEYAIIIEDDVWPTQSLFKYFDKMLEFYKDADNVMMVNGGNLLPREVYDFSRAYTFSRFCVIWGWATWKRAWEKYDIDIVDWPENKTKIEKLFLKKVIYWGCEHELDSVYSQKLDTWDHQWQYAIWKNDGYVITPRNNMVINLGFGDKNATHTSVSVPRAIEEIFERTRESNEEYDLYESIEMDDKFNYLYEKQWIVNWGVSKRIVFKAIISRMLKRKN